MNAPGSGSQSAACSGLGLVAGEAIRVLVGDAFYITSHKSTNLLWLLYVPKERREVHRSPWLKGKVIWQVLYIRPIRTIAIATTWRAQTIEYF